ncbi:MAG: hypothetical protein LBK99_17520 [Opitutaceae bacterium]|jgi:hypothetical protein|nr:hypothetical protein [Opitutaceae bacterium]
MKIKLHNRSRKPASGFAAFLRAAAAAALVIALSGGGTAAAAAAAAASVVYDAAPTLAAANAGNLDPAKGNANWGVLTLFGKDANRAEVRDACAIRDNALHLTDSRLSLKGPASIGLIREFPDAAGPFLVSVKIRPANGGAWSSIKWGPRRLGNWPDLSHGVALTINPAGRWVLWANDKKMKNVIGGGSVPANPDGYRIHLALTAPDAAVATAVAAAGVRKLSIAINGTLVVSDKEIPYPWTRHNLVFQSLANNDAPATTIISDLRIEKLDDANSPQKTAATVDGNLYATGIWLEGEDADTTNFHSGKVIDIHPNGPSGAMFLRVQTRKGQANVPQAPWFAKYKFTVPPPPPQAPTPGSGKTAWHVWLASTPQNASWASPAEWRIDGGETRSLRGSRWVSGTYGNSSSAPAGWVFGWTRAGTVELAPGEHELEILVNETRADGKQWVFCLDSILITNDTAHVPAGPHPEYSSRLAFNDLVAANGGSVENLRDKLNRAQYYELIGGTREQVTQENADAVLEKIMARALPRPQDRFPDATEFGLHGMERNFVVVGRNAGTPEVARAYELLARTGVDSFRSADACWHRLQKNPDGGEKSDTKALHLDFKDLDFQVASAQRYGMTHLFTVGYPPDSLTLARNNKLAACDPRHYDLYRRYFDELLHRYQGKGVRYVELANEVDAPGVWWRGPSSAAHYVAEMKMLREAVDAVKPAPGEMKTAAFAATFSRDNEQGGPKGGRRFVTACFDLGIDNYADAYSVHYLFRLKEKGYHDYFRGEIARAGSPGSTTKPLLNTEQDGQLYPYDGAKAFARVFFLYAIPRMDFFLARDFYEGGYLKPRGLFDIDWRPKLRLLTYAFSVDAMRGRELVGIAQPAPGVEAYVLKRADGYKGTSAVSAAPQAPYSIVLWKNDREVRELLPEAEIAPVDVSGFHSVLAAIRWDLDALDYDSGKPVFSVGDAPIAVFAQEPPAWKLHSREEWMAFFEAGKTHAPLPGSVE